MLSHHLPAEQCGHFDPDPLMCQFPSQHTAGTLMDPRVAMPPTLSLFAEGVGNLPGLYMERVGWESGLYHLTSCTARVLNKTLKFSEQTPHLQQEMTSLEML